jgi:hypothetical protein
MCPAFFKNDIGLLYLLRGDTQWHSSKFQVISTIAGVCRKEKRNYTQKMYSSDNEKIKGS